MLNFINTINWIDSITVLYAVFYFTTKVIIIQLKFNLFLHKYNFPMTVWVFCVALNLTTLLFCWNWYSVSLEVFFSGNCKTFQSLLNQQSVIFFSWMSINVSSIVSENLLNAANQIVKYRNLTTIIWKALCLSISSIKLKTTELLIYFSCLLHEDMFKLSSQSKFFVSLLNLLIYLYQKEILIVKK